jgi:hypothetical protein
METDVEAPFAPKHSGSTVGDSEIIQLGIPADQYRGSVQLAFARQDAKERG